MTGAESPAPIDLQREMLLDPSIRPLQKAPEIGERPAVLLTGATGFVGAYLVDALLRRGAGRVVCLVRATSEAAAQQRLLAALAQYGLAQAQLPCGVEVIQGDLSAVRFGLSPELFSHLAEEIDTVVNNGAWVHLTHPYAMLAPANVGGTREALRFAVTQRVKRVCHVSSLSVFLGTSLAREDVPPPLSPGSTQGYFASKWISEQLVWQALGRGLPGYIVRLGWIAGDTSSGTTTKSDATSLFVRICVRMGLAPRLASGGLALTPVDVAAHAIARAALRPPAGTRACNLHATHHISEQQLWSSLSRPGASIELIDPGPWLEQLRARFPLVAAVLVPQASFLDLPDTPASGKVPPLPQQAARALVAATDLPLPGNQQLLEVYGRAWSRAWGDPPPSAAAPPVVHTPGVLDELLLRFRSCRRLVSAASGQAFGSASVAEPLRISLSALPSASAQGRRALGSALETAAEAFEMRPLEFTHEELERPTASERALAQQLALDELLPPACGPDWLTPDVIESAIRRAVETDPRRSFQRHVVTSRRGLPLHVYECGEPRRPAMLLVLPYGSPAELCFELLQTLGSEYRVLAIESPELTCDPERFERASFGRHESPVDVLSVLDRLEPRRVHLLGLCSSAMTALSFAARQEERISSLTLANGVYVTHVTPRTSHQENLMKLAQHGDSLRERARALFRLASGRAFLEPDSSHLTMLPYTHPDLLFMYLKSCHQFFADPLDGTELASWLGAIQRPALILVEEGDAVAHPEASRIIARGLPNARLSSQSGGSHLSALLSPARALAPAILAFCRGCDGERAPAPRFELDGF